MPRSTRSKAGPSRAALSQAGLSRVTLSQPGLSRAALPQPKPSRAAPPPPQPPPPPSPAKGKQKKSVAIPEPPDEDVEVERCPPDELVEALAEGKTIVHYAEALSPKLEEDMLPPPEEDIIRKTARAVYGREAPAEGHRQQIDPESIAARYARSEMVPAVWTPTTVKTKMEALEKLFPLKMERFHEKPVPPHIAVAFEATRYRELAPALKDNQDAILELAFFTSTDAATAKRVANNYREFVLTTGKSGNEKLILQLDTTNKVPLLNMAALGPCYFSLSPEEGIWDCLHFFPPKEETFEEEEEVEEGEEGEKEEEEEDEEAFLAAEEARMRGEVPGAEEGAEEGEEEGAEEGTEEGAEEGGEEGAEAAEAAPEGAAPVVEGAQEGGEAPAGEAPAVEGAPPPPPLPAPAESTPAEPTPAEPTPAEPTPAEPTPEEGEGTAATPQEGEQKAEGEEPPA